MNYILNVEKDQRFVNCAAWYMEGAPRAPFKDYLHHKTILCHKVALDVQLMNFLFEEKIMFCS